jgi:hypothetical protein
LIAASRKRKKIGDEDGAVEGEEGFCLGARLVVRVVILGVLLKNPNRILSGGHKGFMVVNRLANGFRLLTAFVVIGDGYIVVVLPVDYRLVMRV